MVKWKDEVVEYPSRREILPIEGDVVEITKNVGEVYQNKTPINAENLNDTQDRIDRAWGDNPNIDPRVEWVDHKVEFPNRYRLSYNPDGTANLIPYKGEIIQQGTPVNAENLNKMENRIDNMINIPTDATATPNQLVQGYTAYVGQMKKITGAMKNNSGISKTLTSQSETYIIPEGYQDGTSKVISNISNLVPSNIKSGVNVGGVVGSLIPAHDRVKIIDDSITFTSDDGVKTVSYAAEFPVGLVIAMTNNTNGVLGMSLKGDSNYFNIAMQDTSDSGSRLIRPTSINGIGTKTVKVDFTSIFTTTETADIKIILVR